MNQEQTQTVLTTLARIDERQDGIKEILNNHAKSLSELTVKTNKHENKFSKMRGGMSVLGVLFTAIVGFLGIDFWSS